MRTPIASLQDVCRTYPGLPPVPALQDANVSFIGGQVTAIVGRSGSGKSTLLHVLGLLDRPDSGSYYLAGKQISNAKDNERTRLRASHLGFVFQQFHLIPYRTAAENVELALHAAGLANPERSEIVQHRLAEVGLADRSHHYPAQLSGGEQQRVAVARALASDPILLLCDEPTGNLDSRTAAEVLDLVLAMRAPSRSIVIVTHDSDVARRADRVLTMIDGRVATL